MASADTDLNRPGGKRTRNRRRDLHRRIRALEAEVQMARGENTEALYGLTPQVERAIAEALLDEERDIRLYRLIRPLHSADFADLLERHDNQTRRRLVSVVGKYFDPQVLAELEESVREEIIPLLDDEVLADAMAALDSDDMVEVLGELDEADQARILETIPEGERAIVEEGLAYDEDTAGRMMQRELVNVPQHWTVGQTIDFLRTEVELPDDFYDIFVVDPARRPLGKISLSHLLRNKRPVFVSDIMNRRFTKVPVDMDQEDVAMLFRRYALVSAPVVDGEERLLGMITVDDVVDVIDEEAEEDLLRLGGVTEANIYEDLISTTRRRFSWLAVNLATAIIASGVIGGFQTTIEKIVALAVLMPIVASMGGNAGTQTLTVAVRALAMRELSASNMSRFIIKETTVGSLNGVAFAVLGGAASYLWFGDWQIAGILALSMVITLFVAGLTGTLIPIAMDRLDIDPAIASSVFLTTVTDVIGFFTFLGLASLFLM